MLLLLLRNDASQINKGKQCFGRMLIQNCFAATLLYISPRVSYAELNVRQLMVFKLSEKYCLKFDNKIELFLSVLL